MTFTVAQVGFAAIKGTRHVARPHLQLDRGGPAGDREFCLVDLAQQRALRTVQNPSMIAVIVRWSEPHLRCVFPDGSTVEADVGPAGQKIDFDYWGRVASGHVVAGPWAEAFSNYLGRPVVLVRCEPGQVVFGDAVSVVTRSALAALDELTGQADPARFRATLVIDDHPGAGAATSSTVSGRRPGDLSRPIEATWVGKQLNLGGASIKITAPVARCAVIDVNPITGERDGMLLTALSREAPRDAIYADPIFGVQGVVVGPGTIRPGDRASVAD